MIIKTPTADMTKEQWLEERSKSIGGSEIGTILGLNPYQTAYGLWAERTGKVPAFEGNLATETGTWLEPFVAEHFAQVSGLKVRRTNYIYRNDEWPLLHASPDRLIAYNEQQPWSESCGLEIKTTSAWSCGKFKGVDFPEQYYAQCVQYMMVTRSHNWFLAVLVGNTGFHIYQLTTDPSVKQAPFAEGILFVPRVEFNGLYKAAEDFWQCLQDNVPPDVDGREETAEAIKTVYADVVPGVAPLTGLDALMADYLQAKADAKAAGEKAERFAQQIQIEMGGMESGESDHYKVKWAMKPGRTTFDSKAAIAENPDLTRYQKTGKPYRAFEVKEKK